MLRPSLLPVEKRSVFFSSFLLGHFLKVLSEEGLQLCSSLRAFCTQVKTHTHTDPYHPVGTPRCQTCLINHTARAGN